jgi:hypothetical protein
MKDCVAVEKQHIRRQSFSPARVAATRRGALTPIEHDYICMQTGGELGAFVGRSGVHVDHFEGAYVPPDAAHRLQAPHQALSFISADDDD